MRSCFIYVLRVYMRMFYICMCVVSVCTCVFVCVCVFTYLCYVYVSICMHECTSMPPCFSLLCVFVYGYVMCVYIYM